MAFIHKDSEKGNFSFANIVSPAGPDSLRMLSAGEATSKDSRIKPSITILMIVLSFVVLMANFYLMNVKP